MKVDSKASPSTMQDQKYLRSTCPYVAPSRSKRDVIIIGGGHNGLIAAAYLAKFGLDTLVLERRHCLGGAAVTEEIVPGFKFSRASYLAGLLRPQIITDLNLAKYGFKYISRDPSSFTPTLLDSKYKGKYLLLGSDDKANWSSIAQFSVKDADAYCKYEEFLGRVREILQPLLDAAPPDLFHGTFQDRVRALRTISQLASVGYRHREILHDFYELMVGPAQQILDSWFESDILKATLATDAVIGAAVSPRQSGSAYVLVHHGLSSPRPWRPSLVYWTPTLPSPPWTVVDKPPCRQNSVVCLSPAPHPLSSVVSAPPTASRPRHEGAEL